MRPTVSNSSCLIALHGIRRLALLPQVCVDVIVPDAVAVECSGIPLPSSIQIRQVVDSSRVAQLMGVERLGWGESEAIALAEELGAVRLVLDERRATRTAVRLGLPVIGTIAVVTLAKDKGIISAVRPILDDLVAFGFYISPSLYNSVLQATNE